MAFDIKTNWGKNITVKFYLEKKVKPKTIGDRINLYPLYVMVVARREIKQFKFFDSDLKPRLYSEKEFQEFYGKLKFNEDDFSNDDLRDDLFDGIIETLEDGIITKKRSRTLKNYALYEYELLQHEIKFLLNLFGVFEREKFTINKLPIVIQEYHELDTQIKNLRVATIRQELLKSSYKEIEGIIDWKIDPITIFQSLESLNKTLGGAERLINDINFTDQFIPGPHLRPLLTKISSLSLKVELSKPVSETEIIDSFFPDLKMLNTPELSHQLKFKVDFISSLLRFFHSGITNTAKN